MRVWLDDMRDPTDPEIQRLFGAKGDEVWVKNPFEAVEALLTGTVTHMSFDNDLGWPDFVYSEADVRPSQDHPAASMREGYQVMDWLEEQAYLGQIPPLTITIHSANPAAAARMSIAASRAARYWRHASR